MGIPASAMRPRFVPERGRRLTTHENAGVWEPPEGWRFRTLRHASHECGWSHSHPAWDAGTFRQHCEDHAKVCPWPEPPELVETVSD